jgi:hypothetical protein
MEELYMELPVVLGCLAIFVLTLVWHFSRSHSMLQRWADRNGYHIINRHYRHLFKGPFFWTSSRRQTVYSVTVVDQHGRRRTGWVRCGGWFLGLLSDHVDVRWDD